MADKNLGRSRESIGLVRLVQDLEVPTPLPAVRSAAVAGSRKTTVLENEVIEEYPKSYAPQSFSGHIKFAMRYEPLDLRVWKAVFETIDHRILEEWIRSEPTGVFARRAWYLFELLTGKTLGIPDVPPTGYADLLDPAIHVTGAVTRVRRQRINSNLLGAKEYCPIIRRTRALSLAMAADLRVRVQNVLAGCDPAVLARAIQYLYTKETKSSYAIEGEAPSSDRAQRFVSALSQAAEFNTNDPTAFVRLQNAIVDPRYRENTWRSVQNFVGETRSDFTEHVHFVCPKPADVADLMNGWMKMASTLYSAGVDPVCAAAVVAFGFVFIHPFADGNGRIHRFLIHHVLGKSGFTPPGLLLPVSAAMLRDRVRYDRVLSSFSTPLMAFVQHRFDHYGNMIVEDETADLYRYWDATAFAEYVYGCVEEAIEQDLREELGFLQVFDAALQRVREVVDMPDRRASLLVRLILQNKGVLAKSRRSSFSELTDSELFAIEAAVRSVS